MEKQITTVHEQDSQFFLVRMYQVKKCKNRFSCKYTRLAVLYRWNTGG